MKVLILLVVLAVAMSVVYFAAGFSPAASHYYDQITAPPEPIGKVEVVSLDCDTDKNFGVVKGIIKNSGAVPLKFLNVFLRVNGKMQSVPVLDLQMPVGSMGGFAYATGNSDALADCTVISVQDQQGRSLL